MITYKVWDKWGKLGGYFWADELIFSFWREKITISIFNEIK